MSHRQAGGGEGRQECGEKDSFIPFPSPYQLRSPLEGRREHVLTLLASNS